MQRFIGQYIRQRRREQNITQTELGGDAYSKSYVSAVESGKTVPSAEVLKHFAMRMGADEMHFILLARQIEQEVSQPVPSTTHPSQELEPARTFLHEKAALFETLLDQDEYGDFALPEALLTLSDEALTLLSPIRQAHYHLFRGTILQKQEKFAEAIQAFEAALPHEEHPQHRVAIFDALGDCYLELRTPHLALSYALRAQQLLAQGGEIQPDLALVFRVKLHCGEIYLALGKYQLALHYFEQTYAELGAQQDMQSAGRLYWGLGYCGYALTFQQACAGKQRPEEIERQYQQALSYLLQSRALAQMGKDPREVMDRHLALALIQLDWSNWRRQLLNKAEQANLKALSQTRLFSLLDDASEHCRQALLHWSTRRENGDSPEQRSIAQGALSLLMRIAAQRALVAYSSGYESTFQRERAAAVALSQQTIEACQDEVRLEKLVWHINNIPVPFGVSAGISLPRFPELPLPADDATDQSATLFNQAQIYGAFGVVAEMLGRTSTGSDFCHNCYACADRCFHAELERLKLSQNKQARESDYLTSGYLTRAYQRYTEVLQDRLHAAAQDQDLSQIADALLALCKYQMIEYS